MSLILVGLNHNTAPVEVRERLSVNPSREPEIIAGLTGLPGVRGASVLSTCNRVETILSSESEESIEPVVQMIVSRSGMNRVDVERHLYILRNGDVVRHLFRVAAGLDSMILGEPQIGGQVRESYQRSRELDATDPILRQLFDAALRVAKRVRTDTGIGEHAVSVPYAAVELARKIFGNLDDLNVLLVGAGEIGELTAQHLNGYRLRKVFVANRAHERAVELAERFQGEAINFDSMEDRLRSCEIVIVSTAAPHFLVRPEHVHAALSERRRRSLFLIDLSVPRNIDPAISGIEGAFLYNIDDLREVADNNREKREQKAVSAEEIIDKEVDGFMRRLASHDAVPTILELQGKLDEIRKVELEKCLRRVGPITTEQQQAIEILSTSIINKVLHYPIIRLKETAAADQPEERESIRQQIRRIFGL
jgi:glutamyl-tRNA reductase